MSTNAANSDPIPGLMRELALATTNYHEAPPERFEAARIHYEIVLKKFRAAQGEEAPLVMAAGRTQPLGE